MTTLNIDATWFLILLAAVINVAIGTMAFRLKLVNRSGLYTGVALGFTVFVCFEWQGFLILLTFFSLASTATRFRMDQKTKLGVSQKQGGARSAKHVIANGGIPFFLACAIAVATEYDMVYQAYFAAFTASLATALADTLSTEMGQVYGKKCYLLISMERVKIGTEGAVSYEGTLWGIGGAVFLAALAAMLGMFPHFPVKTAVLVSFAAVIANLVESIIAGIFNQFDRSPNEFVLNFINGAIGASLCFFFVQ